MIVFCCYWSVCPCRHVARQPGAVGRRGAGGRFAVTSLMLMSLAYRQAEAQRLVAIEYTAFIWAAMLGWWFFAEAVTARTLLGTGLIVLGCLVSARGGSR